MSDKHNEKILQPELMQIMQRMRKIKLNILSEQVIYSEYYALEQIKNIPVPLESMYRSWPTG